LEIDMKLQQKKPAAQEDFLRLSKVNHQ